MPLLRRTGFLQQSGASVPHLRFAQGELQVHLQAQEDKETTRRGSNQELCSETGALLDEKATGDLAQPGLWWRINRGMDQVYMINR